MPKYLLQVNYTAEGARGLHKEGGTKRREAAEFAAKSLGGHVEVLLTSGFGKHDVVVIADMPDAIAMTALCMAVTESGAAETVTTPLLTTTDVDFTPSASFLRVSEAWRIARRRRTPDHQGPANTLVLRQAESRRTLRFSRPNRFHRRGQLMLVVRRQPQIDVPSRPRPPARPLTGSTDASRVPCTMSVGFGSPSANASGAAPRPHTTRKPTSPPVRSMRSGRH